MKDQPTEQTTVLSTDELIVGKALGQHLDSQIGQLDFTITSKLAAARHRALDQRRKQPAWYRVSGWQPLTRATAALAVAFIIGSQLTDTTSLMQPFPQTAEKTTGTLMEDLTMLAEGDDIEFYQNIEFLEWLESNS